VQPPSSSDAAAEAAGVAAEALRARLLDALPGLAGGPLAVEVLPAGGLERVGRTGKVVRLVDRRS
jgi:hypothetical protein